LFAFEKVPQRGTFVRTAELDGQRRALGKRPVELPHPLEAGEGEAFSEARREIGEVHREARRQGGRRKRSAGIDQEISV
jgi:hypothetical protein